MPDKKTILVLCSATEENRYVAEQLALRGDYIVSFSSRPGPGLTLFKKTSFDLVVTDLDFPDISSSQLIRELKEIDRHCVIIVLTPTQHDDLARELGVYESIKSPVEEAELFLFIRKGIELHDMSTSFDKVINGLKERNLALEKQAVFLTNRLEESTKNLSRLYENLRTTYLHTIKVLAQAIDARDHYTHSHSQNVVKYACLIAREMGLSAREVEIISDACELHDLGKIGIEDQILGKVQQLTDAEWTQIRRHPVIGAQILEPLSFMNDAIELIRLHHEHYDGSGYPEGRKGDAIPLGARIIHLADAYEAMTSQRAYRKVPMTKQQAVEEIKKFSGAQFDPKVVEAFLRIIDTV